MSVAPTPWASRTATRSPARPAMWPLFAALGLFLMGVGATLGGIGSTPTASSRMATSAVAAAAQHQGQGQGMTARLAAIEPGIAAMTPERVATAASATCDDLRTDIPDGDLVVRTVARFSGGGYALTDRQADRIVAAVRTSYCTVPATP